MNILGIETSCDETAAAVVKDGREVLSNVVYTQIPLHQPYGGVVPEVASRAHIEKIRQVVGDAMAGHAVDAVAVTYGPGLSPALIVGLNAAKGLAKALGVPLFGINHIEAHLHTPFLYDSGEAPSACLSPEDCCPALGLAVSGGNTVWIDMPEYGRYEVIGETLDDAAGEAFDKAAKLLGLGYPGGLKIDRISKAYAEDCAVAGRPADYVPFPKGRPRDGVTALAGLPAELCRRVVSGGDRLRACGPHAHRTRARPPQGAAARRRRLAEQQGARGPRRGLRGGGSAAPHGEAEVQRRPRRDDRGACVLPCERGWGMRDADRRLAVAPGRGIEKPPIRWGATNRGQKPSGQPPRCTRA